MTAYRLRGSVVYQSPSSATQNVHRFFSRTDAWEWLGEQIQDGDTVTVSKGFDE